MKPTCLMLAILLGTSLSLLAEEPKTEELKLLSQYVGEWKGQVQDQPSLTSTSKIHWTVGGTVLEQRYEYADGSTGLILRGYDKTSKQYFFTLMDSRGITLLLTNGSWDAATKTFKFEGYSGSATVTVRSTLTDEKTEDWTITFVDGSNVTELSGKNIRQ